ncbi:tRNA (N(6)-L-threonylcarbamoyladenosine(37)-C(2))-methylthiotransferase MtaB [bacterium]|nr:tRNA (N(6)-L-threonylcarbamoyladenosine(37)-C(2))-methylthiotransferase MtaB [bacterium]
MEKYYIHTMGCKSNQFESSIIVENLNTNGFEKVERIEDAEFFILNSCTVTHKSDNEAMYILRNAKHKNPDIKTILTGCVAQIDKEKLLENDFIDYVIGNNEKLKFAEILQTIRQDNTRCFAQDIMSLGEFNKVVLNDMSKTRASLKIQDGCDCRCSYCIIPFARGKSRSADVDFVIEQINNLSQKGFKEVVFTGIHIGQWGKDFSMELLDLLKEVEKRTSIERFRLGSLNPLEITDEMIEFLKTSKKFCPHFHLSLQSACNKTLKNMNRFYTVEYYLEQIERLNNAFELPFLGSDIIAGFAGETQEDFEITRENLEKSGLTQIHTFPYSIRKGTQAAKSQFQVQDDEKERRAGIIKEISKRKYEEFVQKNIGRITEVLIEKHPDKKSGFLKGVTRNYLTIILNSKDENLLNSLQKVKLTEYKSGRIYGEIIQ